MYEIIRSVTLVAVVYLQDKETVGGSEATVPGIVAVPDTAGVRR